MRVRNFFLINILTLSTLFLSGCSFFIPEDDLNGNNDKVILKDKIPVEESNYKNSQKTKEESDLEQLDQAVSQYARNTKSAPKVEEQPQIIEKTPVEKELLEYYNKYTKATIITNLGKIKVSFYNEEAPLAVGNFIKLSETNFFERLKFHRVISGFMIQGGDPNSRDDKWEDDGQGGPGYAFKDEPNSHKLIRGSLAMANSGKDTNGSQFFILTAQSKPDLDGKHTVFGEVIDGMKVVDDIEKVRINDKDHPTQDVVIEKVELEK
jgi:peptidyl-prolyl cis-trans isomerase B (cyclophilin B)